MNISDFEKEELSNMAKAFKSENWAYINRHLPQWKHAKQFMFLNALPPGTLEDVHHFLFKDVQYLQKTLYELQYTCDCSVTLLRSRGVYSDVVEEEHEGITEFKSQVNDVLSSVGWVKT